VLGAVDALAVEVVAAIGRLERQAQRTDEQPAAPLGIGGDHRDTGDEFDVHNPSLRRAQRLPGGFTPT
jgi:hypothetical protein